MEAKVNDFVRIFSDEKEYSDFIGRQKYLNSDLKNMNGVTKKFLEEHPGYDIYKQNHSNIRCFNCENCENCSYSKNCKDCENCENCSYSKNCKDCKNCNNCNNCKTCEYQETKQNLENKDDNYNYFFGFPNFV